MYEAGIQFCSRFRIYILPSEFQVGSDVSDLLVSKWNNKTATAVGSADAIRTTKLSTPTSKKNSSPMKKDREIRRDGQRKNRIDTQKADRLAGWLSVQRAARLLV